MTPKPSNTSEPTVVMVCGLPRSGTSCVAGVLHHLGVPMGEDGRKGRANPKGFYEDPRLRAIARKSLDNVWDLSRKNTFDTRVELFRQWYKERRNDGPIIGGKYPRLCVMIPEMVQAFPRLQVIAVQRSRLECARSLKRWRPNLSVASIADKLFSATIRRDDAIIRLHVDARWTQYDELIRNPKAEIIALAAFLRISPSPDQIQSAIDFVDPSLNHFTQVGP